IHSHGIVLQSIGKIGNGLLRHSNDPKVWEKHLRRLRDIDWHRSNAAIWEGRATVGGRVSKGAANVLLTSGYIRNVMGLPLPPDEQNAEDGFNRSEQ
ncbi:MAG: DNA sulfur modification protein DndB, partial [Actinomycetota bacterium]